MFNFSSKEQRKAEEYLYSTVVEEIERNEIHKPLWTKALADSGSDKQKAQALYIKYRVQKLKDEISDQEEEERNQAQKQAKIQHKSRKDSKNLETLKTIVKNTISVFHWLILAMLILATVTLFASYIFYDSGGSYKIWVLVGGLLMILGFYLFYITKKVEKTTNHLELKKRLSILFLIFIPFSLLGTVIVIISPILGLGMFITFVGLSIRALKFYNAFNYAKKNNLI